MQRRHLLASGLLAGALPHWALAQALEKPKLTVAVGGKNLLYYLPLTVAEQLGYFKAEGLDVTIVDFAGGSRALQAVVGGSADVVSGAFEHTVNMQFKGQRMRAFVLQGAAPQIVLGINPKTMAGYKALADLKGKKIGVTAPGSSTNVMLNFVLAKAGLKPSDVSVIGVGAGNGGKSKGRFMVQTALCASSTGTAGTAEAADLSGEPVPARMLKAEQIFDRERAKMRHILKEGAQHRREESGSAPPIV